MASPQTSYRHLLPAGICPSALVANGCLLSHDTQLSVVGKNVDSNMLKTKETSEVTKPTTSELTAATGFHGWLKVVAAFCPLDS